MTVVYKSLDSNSNKPAQGPKARWPVSYGNQCFCFLGSKPFRKNVVKFLLKTVSLVKQVSKREGNDILSQR